MQMITSQNVSDEEDAMLRDLKEEQGSREELEMSEGEVGARKCQSAVYLSSTRTHSGDLGSNKKRTEELLEPRKLPSSKKLEAQ